MERAAVLKLTGLSKNFGGLKAVDCLDMVIGEGQICGMIGPNGSGKTTVFNLITGVHESSLGSINLEGIDLTSAKPKDITQQGIARTFQTIRLFENLTTREHVRVGQNCRAPSGLKAFLPAGRAKERKLRQEAEKILTLLSLWEVRDQKAVTLSYGNQRKVEIARALATKPRLLLLDEPAAGMNSIETEELVQIIAKIKDLGISILVIEHDMNFVTGICDRVVVLNFGQKLAEGTCAEVMRNEKVLEAYIGKEN
jgi:branched-chain amino acid transport system ATP-binding protein